MKDPLGLEEMDLALHIPMVTSPRDPWVTPPQGTPPPSYKSAIHSPQPPHPNPKEQLVPLLITSSQALARAGPSNMPQEVAQLQKEMNPALGQVLTMKAALDSNWRELEWDLDSAMPECEAQAARAIQEVESLCATTIKEVEACRVATIKEVEDHSTACVHALQQSHREDILNFECKVQEKEECTHLMFLEVCGAAFRACPIEAHRILLYPLQLLMGNIPPASLPTAILQPAPPEREPPLTVPLPWHLNCHPLPQGLNSRTAHLGRRLLEQLLLPKSLLVRGGKRGSPSWGSNKPAGRPFVRTPT